MKYITKIKKSEDVRDSEYKLKSKTGVVKVNETKNNYKDIYETINNFMNVCKKKGYELIDISICVREKKRNPETKETKTILKFVDFENEEFFTK